MNPSYKYRYRKRAGKDVSRSVLPTGKLEVLRRRDRERWRARRLDAIRVLGYICERCGNGDERVLTIDHREQTENGVHVPELRKRGQGNNMAFLLRVIKGTIPKSEVQLLCANCHTIKTRENEEVPYRGKGGGAVERAVKLPLFDGLEG